MTVNDNEVDLVALAEGTLSGPEWESWLTAHPTAAAEIEVARRVRALVAQMRSIEVELPTDFEARVLAQVGANTTALDLLELIFVGAGRTLRELLDVFFAERPTSYSSGRQA